MMLSYWAHFTLSVLLKYLLDPNCNKKNAEQCCSYKKYTQ